jgi:cytochrome c oxidase cbb3-type subunit 3
MYSRCLASLIAVLCVAGCDRERREFSPPAHASVPATTVNALPGGEVDGALRARMQHVYGDNAYQISQGQTLYSAFNCNGCHAHGGGDIGPPLMDDKWIYGGQIDQVYLSIAQGRANGMPPFAGRIPPQQMWQIAAYVRSLGGHGPKAARPSRQDHLHTPVPQEMHTAPLVQAERP